MKSRQPRIPAPLSPGTGGAIGVTVARALYLDLSPISLAVIDDRRPV